MYHSGSASVVLALAAAITSTAAASPAGPEDAGAGGGGARVSNALNPAMSVNALFLGGWRSSDTGRPEAPATPLAGPGSGITLQEAELIFTSTVDPYLTADAIVAIRDEPASHEYAVELEEVFVTVLRMPRGLGLRAGKMYLPFGRHNLLHTHQRPFIDGPVVNERSFGEEGLNEAALELSWLPRSPWYCQIAGAVGDGRNERLFASERPEHLMYLVHWKNLWDLSESATLELGGTGTWGHRGEDAWSRSYGLNATWKYRPARRAIYRSFEVQGELIHRDRDALAASGPEATDLEGLSAAQADHLTGGYLHVRWQALRRWWLQGRWDRVAYRGAASEQRFTALAAFVPSEFSALRLQYSTLDPVLGRRDHQLLAQLNFTIGSHPAHAY